MSKVILQIDGNNFYASCEQMIDPSIKGKGLVVLSNNDGCIIARSSEARRMGIPTVSYTHLTLPTKRIV